MSESKEPVVGIIMGSVSDMDIMAEAMKQLDEFAVPYEVRIVSAHRTPDAMATYGQEAAGRGLKVIIAGAGGSAHLPGMTAAYTTLPVLAVPVKRDNHDHEALWSSVKMPGGVPVATMPENGGKNAALYAVRILALSDATLVEKCVAFEKKMHDDVLVIDKNLQADGWQKTLAG